MLLCVKSMELYLGRIEILNGDKYCRTENGDKSGDKMMSDVFVIGAGCSVPYGFPTGATLMQKLKNFDYGTKFPRKNYSDGDIFLVDLYQEHFGYSSIDNKIEYQSDYAMVLPYPEHEKLYNQLMDAIVLPFSQSVRNSMMGLYNGLGMKDIHKRKGLKKNEQILDHMGATELAANLFRITQTDDKLRRENIKGKEKANEAHFAVGKKVRQTIAELGGTMPENLPTPKISAKKLKQERKKAIAKK